MNEKCDRKVCLYGYLRGTHLKRDTLVHVAGVGDLKFEVCLNILFKGVLKRTKTYWKDR